MSSETAAQDLAYIRRLMQDTHFATVAHGHFFVVWGIIVSVGLVLTWLMATGELKVPWYGIWAPLIASGWAYTFFAVRRGLRTQPTLSNLGRLIGHAWMTSGVAMTLTFFVGMPLGVITWKAGAGLIGVFMGMGVMLTALIAEIPWLIYVAIGWWLGAVILWLVPGMDTLAVLGVLVALLQIVPGIVLTMQNRRLRARQP
jgi:hypothetical protein